MYFRKQIFSHTQVEKYENTILYTLVYAMLCGLKFAMLSDLYHILNKLLTAVNIRVITI